jgi:hypothetical protein
MMRSPPPAHVPTLTQVVMPPTSGTATEGGSGKAKKSADEFSTPALAPALAAEIEELIAQRLPAAFDKAWRQLLPALIDATHRELASSLREVIDRAAAEQSAGHRDAVLVRSIPAASSTDADAPGSAGLPR